MKLKNKYNNLFILLEFLNFITDEIINVVKKRDKRKPILHY